MDEGAGIVGAVDSGVGHAVLPLEANSLGSWATEGVEEVFAVELHGAILGKHEPLVSGGRICPILVALLVGGGICHILQASGLHVSEALNVGAGTPKVVVGVGQREGEDVAGLGGGASLAVDLDGAGDVRVFPIVGGAVVNSGC